MVANSTNLHMSLKCMYSPIKHVHTGLAIGTWTGETFIRIHLTKCSFPAIRAITNVPTATQTISIIRVAVVVNVKVKVPVYSRISMRTHVQPTHYPPGMVLSQGRTRTC